MKHARHRALRRYSGLAGKYLVQQRKRTSLTIVAVVLSVALITSAGVFAQSIRELAIENVRARFGGFYAQVDGFSADQLRRLRHHLVTETVGSTIVVGTMPLTDELRAFVHAPDRTWIDAMGYHLVDGRFPSGPGEIAIERWLLQAARRPADLGGEVAATLVLGGRSAAGSGPTNAKVTYTVVGFIAPDAAGIAEGVAAALISQADAHTLLGADARYRAAFTTTDRIAPQEAIATVASSFALDADEVYQNTALLAAIGESRSSVHNDAIRSVEGIVALVLIAATVAVIYNSFAISVTERIRQFGILRTVGATPRQIRRVVYRQAGIIALAGAPIGLAAGLVAVRLVVLVFNSLSMDIGFAGVSMTYPLHVLIGGPVLGAISVYASALLPARAAGRVSPLQAVLAEGRFVKDRIKARRSPLLSRVFGISGRIASQNLRRHPGRFAVTVFSIGIGVALFVTFAGFFRIMTLAASSAGSAEIRGDVTVTVRGEEPVPIAENGRETIESLPWVESLFGLYEAPGYVVLPAEEFGDVEDQVEAEVADHVRETTGQTGPVGEISVLGLEEEGLLRIRPLILDGWRTPDEFVTIGGAYVPEGYYDIGETLPLVVDGRRVDLPVVGLADLLPGGNYNSATVVTSIETARRIAGSDGYTGMEVDVAAGASAQDVARSIEAVIGNREDVFAFDMSAVEQSGRQINLQMSILLYGLVAVVGLIGALNIVNTITTNLILRVREFGTLRAVGMSGAQMRGMVRVEAVLYGVWAVVGGGAVGAGLTRMLYNSVGELQSIPWQFPWSSLLASVIVAVGLSMLSAAAPMRRISQMDIVESIRGVE